MEGRFHMPSTYRSNSHSSGFTLVEVLFVAPIVLLTIAVFVGILISLTGEVLVARNSNSLAYNAQNALNTIEQDVRLSGAFLATNSIPIVSPQGFNDDTTGFPNVVTSSVPGARIVLNAIATSGGANQLARSPVWLADDPSPCGGANVNQNKVLTFNIIYFVKNNTLWRRTLMPSDYTTIGCTAPSQQPSCNPSQTAVICVARDVRLLDDVTNFTVDYLTSAASSTPVANATDTSLPDNTRQTALSTTDTVRVTLSATKTVAGRDATYNGILHATRIGTKIEY